MDDGSERRWIYPKPAIHTFKNQGCHHHKANELMNYLG